MYVHICGFQKEKKMDAEPSSSPRLEMIETAIDEEDEEEEAAAKQPLEGMFSTLIVILKDHIGS